jgi:zinc protease
MTLEKLDAQREVVRNERRQNTENTPYGKVELRLPELLYPPGHPYHHPVIGSHEDLEAATVADVQTFFAEHYQPGNASLVVAGDFDPQSTKRRIERLFGSIPGKPKAPPLVPDAKPTLTTVARETMDDDVELEKIFVAWQTPRHFAPGDAELDLLATALATGKASRLYKALVYDQKIAQAVEAQQDSGMLGSRFVVGVTARPGTTLDKLEAAIDKELAAVRANALSDDEMTRAKNLVETSFVRRLESVRERASLLNMYEAEVGDPGYAAKDLERYRTATKDGVKAIAAKFLRPEARAIVRVVPRNALRDPRRGEKAAK